MECAGIVGRADRRHDQVAAENVARAVRARSGHGTANPAPGSTNAIRPAGLRQPSRSLTSPPKTRMAWPHGRPAARVHAGGHQYRRRANPPGSPHRRTMEQARAIPAHDLRRGTAAPPNRKNQHGRRHARGPVKTLGTGKSLVELQRRFAEQAKASARHMVEKQARNAGDQGKFVEQANLLNKAGATTEARATMLWQARSTRCACPVNASPHAGSARKRSCSPLPPTSPRRSSPRPAAGAVKRLLPNIDQLPDDERSPTRLDVAKCTRTPCTRWRMT